MARPRRFLAVNVSWIQPDPKVTDDQDLGHDARIVLSAGFMHGVLLIDGDVDHVPRSGDFDGRRGTRGPLCGYQRRQNHGQP
jgi:hypothetical protein